MGRYKRSLGNRILKPLLTAAKDSDNDVRGVAATALGELVKLRSISSLIEHFTQQLQPVLTMKSLSELDTRHYPSTQGYLQYGLMRPPAETATESEVAPSQANVLFS